MGHQQHPEHSQPGGAVGGRPPSLPGRLTPSTQQGGPATPQQQNGSHPLSHPPPTSSSAPALSVPGSSGAGDCGNLADINFDSSLMNGDANPSGLDVSSPSGCFPRAWVAQDECAVRILWCFVKPSVDVCVCQ